MTVTAHDLLASVKSVEKLAKCEADWRGLCGRAYYAIYQDGKAFHDSLPSPGKVGADSRAGMHADLIERLLNPSIARTNPDFLKSQIIGASMKTIYTSRVKADYHRGQTVDKSTASNSVLLASSVLSALATLAPAPAAVSTPAPEKGGRPTLTVIK